MQDVATYKVEPKVQSALTGRHLFTVNALAGGVGSPTQFVGLQLADSLTHVFPDFVYPSSQLSSLKRTVCVQLVDWSATGVHFP